MQLASTWPGYFILTSGLPWSIITRAPESSVIGGLSCPGMVAIADLLLVRTVVRCEPAATSKNTIGPSMRAGWIGGWAVHIVLLIVPVGTPAPEITCHIMESNAVGREPKHRGWAAKLVAAPILMRKPALPEISLIAMSRNQVAPPGVWPIHQATTRGTFVLRFC